MGPFESILCEVLIQPYFAFAEPVQSDHSSSDCKASESKVESLVAYQ